MIYKKIYLQNLGVSIEASSFADGEGATEWHVVLHVEPRADGFQGQIERIYAAEDTIPSLTFFAGARYVLKRYFLSDSTNQEPLMRKEKDVSLSVIQQQPLDGSKVAVWMYLLSDADVHDVRGVTIAEHNGYKHLWKMGMYSDDGDSAAQTSAVLTEYEAMLKTFGATLADNCIRTWFFVRDVDTQYANMVKARRENFALQGLTEKTHFIASTGIGGVPASTRAIIQMGAYAMTGFEPSQMHYLYAPSHLNPTYEYGVTFERGTVMEYGDRRHVIISGTASINNRGEVMHQGDVVKQTQRMWENVETLLSEGGATYDDVAQLVVYLRDIADFPLVRQMFAERFPDIPTVITLAPVCRPSWLIEIECVAIRAQQNTAYRAL